MHTDCGIVLRSFNYKERSRIFTLFSREGGVLSLIARTAAANLTTPLCYGEFLYTKGRSDLYSLKEGRILDMHMSLRLSYDHLRIATKLLQAILDSQLPGHPAPKLFDLLLVYLKHLPKNPEAFYVSFLLKLLKHEGVLALSPEARILYQLQNATSLDAVAAQEVTSSDIEMVEGMCRSLNHG